MIGGGDVVAPDVVLPLPQAEHAAEDAPRVDAHPHVELHVRGLHDRAAEEWDIGSGFTSTSRVQVS